MVWKKTRSKTGTYACKNIRINKSVVGKWIAVAFSTIAVLFLQSIPVDSKEKPQASYMQLGGPMLPPIDFTKFCIRKPTRCAPTEDVEHIVFGVHHSTLERIQREVNQTITVVTNPLRGLRQPWSDDAAIGNCVEFALTKRSRLLDLGYPSSALLLAAAFVPSGEGHLVDVVVTDEGDFVLDNLQSSVVRWDKLSYHWIGRSTPENPKYWQKIVPPLLVSESEQLHESMNTNATQSCTDEPLRSKAFSQR